MVNKLKQSFFNYNKRQQEKSEKKARQEAIRRELRRPTGDQVNLGELNKKLDLDSLGRNNSYRSRTEGKASKVNPSSTSKTKPTPRSSKKPVYNLLFR